MYEGGWLLSVRGQARSRWASSAEFWRPVIEFARIDSATEFREFDEPGFAKTVYDLSARELGPKQTPLGVGTNRDHR